MLTEQELSRKPLRIDALLIKSDDGYQMRSLFGRIFQKYNILEYKGYGDYLSVDDYYKGLAYVYLYKAGLMVGEKKSVDYIKIQELTLTFVCYSYPRKLFKHLKEQFFLKIKELEKGIYQIQNEKIPVQIIVQKQLIHPEFRWIKNLSRRISIHEMELLTKEAKGNPQDVFRDELLQFLLDSNESLKGEQVMCKIFDELRTEGRAEGENNFARLTEHLLKDSRIQDLQQAIKNIDYRKKLYHEYNI